MSGAQQVPAETVFGTAPNNDVHHHVLTDLPITKNGGLYIYVSNQTPNIAVFFDNLQVTPVGGNSLLSVRVDDGRDIFERNFIRRG